MGDDVDEPALAGAEDGDGWAHNRRRWGRVLLHLGINGHKLVSVFRKDAHLRW